MSTGRCAMTREGRAHLHGMGRERWIACARCGWQSRVYRRGLSLFLLGMPAWLDHSPSPERVQ